MSVDLRRALAVCGEKIVGCYRPTAGHCEVVLENAATPHRLFASIWSLSHSSTGDVFEEVDSVECLLTRQGLYTFRSYSSCNGLDVALLWAFLWFCLLQNGTIKCVIIPNGFPNPRAYECS